ncbi:7SK snRNA methylphosphate capping enzyme-like [Dreissena polymorpha]|uniref:RNA methyltransferase n=1 Tax=Dreissena polymorpha TaxID=45954 RepID=A0A9D4H096_DREPO|nr:7SK snRNA methylphosphate capping enzyme-like [Dreissena polymorpha]KAH3826959.1 hypothetical protein DPMN_128887 [Dreissena polymorpha]
MSVQVKTHAKTEFDRVEMACSVKSFSSPEAFRKSKDDSTIKSESRFTQPWGRKRRYSQSGRRDDGAARRKRIKSTPSIGPLPNKFLNGGSIDDPLNLNGLDHSELGKQLNSVTPQSSPLPSRRESIKVAIPFDFTDPLKLNDSDESLDFEKLLRKKRQRSRHRKKDDGAIFSPPKNIIKDKNLMEALKIEIDTDQFKDDANAVFELKPKELVKPRSVCDKIVSPVIPQVSPKCVKRRRTNSGSKTETSPTIARSLNLPSNHLGKHHDKKTPPKNKFRQPKPPQSKRDCNKSGAGKKTLKFIYGNYNRYYGYRNPTLEEDGRLKCFRKEWFESKCVLDIGCNVGNLTMSLALKFNPAKVTGMDIDPSLIGAARKNVRYYMSANLTEATKFPISNLLSYGPIVAPPVSNDASKQPVFPHNVLFKQGNYVLETDELLDLQKEEFDVILALSITKWIHFNWGDEGLRRFFKRVYKQLRPGGRFILEPQPWSSYKKKKKLTPTIHENFKSIHLRPEQFTDYLLSRDVGFSTCNTVDVPYNASKGFRRPILVFFKSDTIQNSPWSEVGSYTPVPIIHTTVGAFHDDGSLMSEDSSSSSSDSSCSQCSEVSGASSLANCDRIVANLETCTKRVTFDMGVLKPGTSPAQVFSGVDTGEEDVMEVKPYGDPVVDGDPVVGHADSIESAGNEVNDADMANVEHSEPSSATTVTYGNGNNIQNNTCAPAAGQDLSEQVKSVADNTDSG